MLAAAIRQVPATFGRKITVRVDGAGASHDLVRHLLGLSSARKSLLFTCGWMITAADEAAIMQLPRHVWQPSITQDGNIEQDKDVAEITHLMSRAASWPGELRWIDRRVKPSRRQMPNLTAYEKKTGWRYSITCTNIPDAGIAGVAGSHHPQYIDIVHREHAVVETGGVETAKALGLRNLPACCSSRSWSARAASPDNKGCPATSHESMQQPSATHQQIPGEPLEPRPGTCCLGARPARRPRLGAQRRRAVEHPPHRRRPGPVARQRLPGPRCRRGPAVLVPLIYAAEDRAEVFECCGQDDRVRSF